MGIQTSMVVHIPGTVEERHTHTHTVDTNTKTHTHTHTHTHNTLLIYNICSSICTYCCNYIMTKLYNDKSIVKNLCIHLVTDYMYRILAHVIM